MRAVGTNQVRSGQVSPTMDNADVPYLGEINEGG